MKLINRTYVKAYVADNLGDDIFLRLLFERYRENKFLLIANNKYKIKLKKYSNVKVINSVWFKIYDKFCGIFHMTKYFSENVIASICCEAIEIGGSMFIEPNKPYFNNCLFGNKKMWVLGVNFGPYQSLAYKETCEDFFRNVEDVCFRDKKSLQIFSNLSNVRYAPDLVFSLDPRECIEKQKVFISVMDFETSHPELRKYQSVYEKYLYDIICLYLEKEYEVVLAAFCESEGDLKIVDKLYNKIESTLKSNILCVNYEDNMDELLMHISESNLVVGSRFHSIVLGLSFGKKVLPICYSNKTFELLQDLKIQDYAVWVNDITNETIKQNKVCSLDTEQIRSLRKQAELHFEKLDKVIKNRI